MSRSDPSVEPAELPPCGLCRGEGGRGDDRCAIVVCEECDGTGLWRLGGLCPCGCGVRGDRLDPATGYRRVIECARTAREAAG